MPRKSVWVPPKSYVISVSLGTGCYRHIKIDADSALSQFSSAILDAFGFDDDHMHAFFMDNRAWSQYPEACYWSDPDDEDEMEDNVNPSTDEVSLRDLQLADGQKFLYVFDFGDDWRFSCRVLKILDEQTKEPQVVRSVGDAPEQYPDFDEEDWEEDEEDPDEEE